MRSLCPGTAPAAPRAPPRQADRQSRRRLLRLHATQGLSTCTKSTRMDPKNDSGAAGPFSRGIPYRHRLSRSGWHCWKKVSTSARQRALASIVCHWRHAKTLGSTRLRTICQGSQQALFPGLVVQHDVGYGPRMFRHCKPYTTDLVPSARRKTKQQTQPLNKLPTAAMKGEERGRTDTTN